MKIKITMDAQIFLSLLAIKYQVATFLSSWPERLLALVLPFDTCNFVDQK